MKTNKSNYRISLVVLCAAVFIIIAMLLNSISVGAASHMRETTSTNVGAIVTAVAPKPTKAATCHVVTVQGRCGSHRATATRVTTVKPVSPTATLTRSKPQVSPSNGVGYQECHIMSAQHCSNVDALLYWHAVGNTKTPTIETPEAWTLQVSCIGIGSSEVTMSDAQRQIGPPIKVACDQLPQIITFDLADALYFTVVEPQVNAITIEVQ